MKAPLAKKVCYREHGRQIFRKDFPILAMWSLYHSRHSTIYGEMSSNWKNNLYDTMGDFHHTQAP